MHLCIAAQIRWIRWGHRLRGTGRATFGEAGASEASQGASGANRRNSWPGMAQNPSKVTISPILPRKNGVFLMAWSCPHPWCHSINTPRCEFVVIFYDKIRRYHHLYTNEAIIRSKYTHNINIHGLPMGSTRHLKNSCEYVSIVRAILSSNVYWFHASQWHSSGGSSAFTCANL